MKIDGIDLVLNSPITDSIIGNAELKPEVILGGGGTAVKNIIINGNFDVWQRNTGLSAGAGVRRDCDRFFNGSIGDQYSTSRQTFTIGQTNVPDNPTYFHRTTNVPAIAPTNQAGFHYNSESVAQLSGKTITLSFYAKADANINIATEFSQNFGTGGTPSSEINSIGVTTHALTTNWQQFTVTQTIPSITGKTLGTNGNDFFQLCFWLSAGANFDARTNSLGQQAIVFDVSHVQIEIGSSASSFESQKYGEVLRACQRYFFKTFPKDIVPGQMSGQNGAIARLNSGGNVTSSFEFPVEMRVAPTVTTYNPQQNNSNWRRTDNVNDATDASVSSGLINPGGLILAYTGGTVDQSYWIHLTCDAEL